jgi:hypothetical protein
MKINLSKLRPIKAKPVVIDTSKLVNGPRLLEILFPEDCRPTLRWLQRQQKARVVPYYKIGHHVFFDVPAVREKLERKNLIRAV